MRQYIWRYYSLLKYLASFEKNLLEPALGTLLYLLLWTVFLTLLGSSNYTALIVVEIAEKLKLWKVLVWNFWYFLYFNPLMPGGKLQVCLSMCDLFVTTRDERVNSSKI